MKCANQFISIMQKWGVLTMSKSAFLSQQKGKTTSKQEFSSPTMSMNIKHQRVSVP